MKAMLATAVTLSVVCFTTCATVQGSLLDVPLEGALALYSLNAAQVFREPVQDSKAMVAWGPDAIVITFRGTASFSNVLNDIKVCAILVHG